MKDYIGLLIAFKLSTKLNKPKRAKFFRDLYGYNDKSQFGKYTYKRAGLLEKENITYIKLNRAVIIIKKNNKNKVISFLKKKTKLIIREIILSKEDKRNLLK